MNKYNLFCTEEQTKKALELGAPINIEPYDNEHLVPQKYPKIIVKYPTAEQMIGWLRTKGFIFYMAEYKDHVFWRVANNHDNIWYEYDKKLKDPKEATLAAIDAALEYLTNKKLNNNEN